MKVDGGRSVGTIVKQVSECEVCGSQELLQVLDLGEHPLCDDLVPIGVGRVCLEYPIEILFCQTCATAHQRFQVPKYDLFPSNYHYRSRFTADVLSGMARLVESCETRYGSLAGKKVVDIGCNDGSLLSAFRGKGAVTIGIEPTDASLDARESGHVVYGDYLSEELASEIVAKYGNPDLIVLTNVFAHIENLTEVLDSLRRLMSRHTVLVIENHYLGSVLDGNQFDTFYHEHPRTYSLTSFRYIAGALRRPLADAEFPSRYGGNIRVFLGPGDAVESSGVRVQEVLERESKFLERFATMRKNISLWRERKLAIIAEEIAAHGKLRAKAFPGRAAILVKLLGLDHDAISAVYEKPGSMKIGHYLPGTRIPILSDHELFALPHKSKTLLNLAWHIPTEIRRYLTEHGYTGAVRDIVSAEDFSSDR